MQRSVEKMKKVKTQDLEIEAMKKKKSALPYSKKSGFTKGEGAIGILESTGYIFT